MSDSDIDEGLRPLPPLRRYGFEELMEYRGSKGRWPTPEGWIGAAAGNTMKELRSWAQRVDAL